MTNLETAVLARKLAQVAIEKNAKDVRLLDLREVVSYTDFFIVCTASNNRLTKAVSDHIIDRAKELNLGRPRRQEADVEGTWLLLDYVDVIVHIFTPDAREFYRLESLWGQVPQEAIEDEAGSTDSSSVAQA